MVAPHTSNWNFVHLLAASFLERVSPYWLGKHTLLRGPFGWLLRKFGGITHRPSIEPAPRRHSNDILFIDYARKLIGTGPRIMPAGDLDADMQTISEFYETVEPKYPAERSIVAVKRDNLTR